MSSTDGGGLRPRAPAAGSAVARRWQKAGFSITSEPAATPDHVESTRFALQASKTRVTTKGHRTTIKRSYLRNGAEHLVGERSIRIYENGKLTRIEPSPYGQEFELGTGEPVASEVDLLEVQGPGGWMPVGGSRLSYDAKQPYAITFATGRDASGSAQAWSMSRDVLAEALDRGQAGLGDLHLEVGDGGSHLHVTFMPGTTQALKGRLPLGDVKSFLAASYASVPRNSESAHLDLDGTIKRILDAAP